VRSELAALGAVILWASLAALGSLLSDIPPFLLTGIGLLIGSLISLPVAGFQIRKLVVKPRVLLLGVYGLFGYHAALFAALQNAPPVQANLVNYLWPLLIVVLAPLFFPAARLTLRKSVAALAGFVGAGLAILSGSQITGGLEIGYLYGLLAALIWSTYSLGTKRIGDFPTAGVGLFGLVAGVLALAAHLVFEERVAIEPADWPLLVALGLGALGGAFYLWDYALKRGDAQRIGMIAFITPLLSTLALVLVTGSQPSGILLIAAALIFGGAWLGGRENN
jgi:drug/metabolite transporter (DMT)-like permease